MTAESRHFDAKTLAKLDDYQTWVLGKLAPESTESSASLMLNAVLGISGEGGEVADRIKKLMFHGHKMTQQERAKLEEEGGDLLFYLACYASALGLRLSQLVVNNVDKLDERYPNGFDIAASRARYAEQQDGSMLHSGVGTAWFNVSEKRWPQSDAPSWRADYGRRRSEPDRTRFPNGFSVPLNTPRTQAPSEASPQGVADSTSLEDRTLQESKVTPTESPDDDKRSDAHGTEVRGVDPETGPSTEY